MRFFREVCKLSSLRGATETSGFGGKVKWGELNFYVLAALVNAMMLFPSASQAEVGGLAEIQQKIDEYVQEAHQLLSFHGNIEVRLADRVIYKNSLGLANEEFEVPHSDRSRFMIASVSKQFTAALVLKLVELGELNLEAPISTHVEAKQSFQKDNLDKWSQVTLHQLLTHTSGAMRDVRFTEYYSNSSYQPFLSSIVLGMAKNYNLFPGKPNAQSRYSNMGYMLLAYVVESVTRMEFHEAVETYLLEPLQLDSTGQYHRMFAIKS
ncbi:MAG: serine hydrolase domain-containing protein, partial [Pseudomonadota bacterium]